MADRDAATENSEDQPIWVLDLIAWLKKIQQQNLTGEEWVKRVEEVLAELPGQGLPEEFWQQAKMGGEAEKAAAADPPPLSDNDRNGIQAELDRVQTIGGESRREQAICNVAAQLPANELQLLQQALTAAQTIGSDIGSEGYRSGALAAVAAQLPSSEPQLLQQALIAAQNIENGDFQSRVLAAVVAQLPAGEPELFQQALTAAQKIKGQDGYMAKFYQSKVLEAVVAQLPASEPQLLQQAITATQTLKSEEYSGAIAAIAAHLTDSQRQVRQLVLQQVLTSTQAIEDERYRWQALANFSELLSAVAHLPASERQPMLQQAITDDQKIGDAFHCSQALVAVAVHLPASERQPVLQQALTAAQKIGGEKRRSNALAAVAAVAVHLPASERQPVLQQALTDAECIGFVFHSFKDSITAGAVAAVAAVAVHLPDSERQPVLQQALTDAEHIEDAFCRSKALVAVAVYLPDSERQPVLQKALTAAQKIREEQYRSEALIAVATVAAHLPDSERQPVLQKALTAAQTIESEWYCVPALVAVAAQIPASEPQLLQSALTAAQTIKSEEYRSEALATVAAYLPVSERQPVLQEALTTAQKIGDEKRRSNALAAVAAQLSASEPQLLQSALTAAQNIGYEEYRSAALATVAAQVPGSKPQLLQQLIQIASAIDTPEHRITALRETAFRITEALLLHAPQTLLVSLLRIVPKGKTTADRARLLSALAPKLSPGLFPRALQLIQTEISHPVYQAETLGNLAPYLPTDLLSEALDLVQQHILGYSYPTTALCALIPHLSLTQLQKALVIAFWRIRQPLLATQILRTAATRLSDANRSQPQPDDPSYKNRLIRHLLKCTQRYINDEKSITTIITALAPSLNSDSLDGISENILPKLLSEFYRAQVLAALATSPNLTPQQLTPFREKATELSQAYPKVTALSAFIPRFPELHPIIAQIQADAPNAIQATDLSLILATRPHRQTDDSADLSLLTEDQTKALRLIRDQSRNPEKANALIKLTPHLRCVLLLEAQSIAQDIQDSYHRARSLLALATHFPEVRAAALTQIASLQTQDPIQHIELLSQYTITVPEQISALLKVIKVWADKNKFKEDSKEPDPNTFKRRRILIALKPHLPIRLVREIDRQTGIGKAPQDLWERALFVLRTEYRQALKIGSLRNDATQDEDLLNLKDEINALTEMLLMRDLEPPVAVGILGGWGGGKSYIMHLMQTHMVAIRSQKMEEAIEAWGFKDDGSTSPDGDRVGRFVGHIYQIKFDAWTYAKANLWASLMQEIFYELNRQISLEQKLGHILSDLHQSSDPEAVPDSSSSKQRSDRYLDQFIYDPISNIGKNLQKIWQYIYKLYQQIYKRITNSTEKLLNLFIVQFVLHIIVFFLLSPIFLIKSIRCLVAFLIIIPLLITKVLIFYPITKFHTGLYLKIGRPILILFGSFLDELQYRELPFDKLFSRQIANYYFQDYSLNNTGDKSDNAPYNSVIENILNRIIFLVFVGFQKRLSDRRQYWKKIITESNYKPVATEDLISPNSSSDISSKAFGQALREGGKLWQALYLMDEEERSSFLQSNLKPSQFKDWKESASKTEISNSLWDLLAQIKQEEKQLFKQKEQDLEAKEKELQRQLKKAEEDVNQRLAQRSVTAFWKPVINAVAKLHFSDEKIKEFTEKGKTYTMLRQTVTSWQGLLALFTMTLLIVLTLDIDTRTAILEAIQALLGKFGIADWFNQLIQSILIWFESLPQWIKEIPKEVPTAIQIPAAITATVTALLPILKSLGNYITSVQKEQAEIQSKREVLLKEEQDKVAGLIQEVASLKLQVDEQRREVGLTADYSSLLDFVNSRLKDGDYSKHLGLMHQFKDDLWKLSNSLLPPANATEFKTKLDKLQQIFPRGPARVVVYIDDLDRCPPNTVVEVLEAVQLLVKNPLFIAVLAIDERYINRALAQHYKGVLSLQGSPSSADYLEKIIQIPYRVRPIAEDALRSYLRAQIVVQDSETSGTKFNEFSPQEFDILVTCCQETELSPRSLKRLTNVYKLYKILSRTRGQRPTPREQKAILTLLVFSSRYPDLMRDILENIGSHYEEGLHLVEQDSETETLANVINTYLYNYEKRNPNSNLAQDVKKLRHDVKKLVADDLKLKEIRQIFDFVRSFSFVGDIGADFSESTRSDRLEKK